MRILRPISICLLLLIATADIFGQNNGTMTMYRAEISFGESSFQGLMAYKHVGDDEYNCSMVNDIGVKAFDFRYQSGKVKFSYVISFLDRAIIKKVMKKDLSLLFGYGIPALDGNSKGQVWPQKKTKPKQTVITIRQSDDEVLLLNDKRYNLQIRLFNIEQ